MAADSQTYPITLSGAWQGQVGDPQRQFRGQVLTSDLPELAAGQKVTVRYDVTDPRPGDAKQHGRYMLSAGRQSYYLTALTCPSTARSGQQGNDDTKEAEWHAQLVK